MKYRQYILLSGMDSHEQKPEEILPDESIITKGWYLTRAQGHITEEFLHYLKPLIPGRDFSELQTTQFILYKDVHLSQDDPNAFVDSKVIKEVIFESWWICIALRLVRMSGFKPHRLLVRMEANNQAPVQATAIYDRYFTPPGFSNRDVSFRKADVPFIRKYSEELIDLAIKYENKHHRVLNALDFFNESLREYRYDTKFLFVSVALESLYSYKTQGITEQIALGAASFLEATVEGRERLYKELKEAYAVRSAIVHGDKQKQEFYQNKGLQRQTMANMYHVVVRSLASILENNYEHIFNDKQKLESAMIKLKLGKNETPFLRIS